ncbi:dephospho-CoA kinase [Microbacterium resistens]|uniref:Dephospho-CoA kinase n=1 Tax=Microbacterium resistens TaxID=156977 RepID=A0ABU1SG28_9MICO|nr:GrpB family protein [Microbacterium resistens]MDR6868572.1 dephospho-CoA kinase [Microbacterium resistens]
MASARIVPYDPGWPVLADEWLSRIETALSGVPGAGSFVYEHIGSTAVPGLAAKPIIDLQLRAPTLPEVVPVTVALDGLGLSRALGSRPDSPGVHADIPRPGTSAARHEKLLFHRPAGPGPTSGESEVILHVRLADSPFADFVVAFRDWLRRDEEARREYEALKRALAAEHADAADYDDYTRAKSRFMDAAQGRMGWRTPRGDR